jgi:DNA polymerase I
MNNKLIIFDCMHLMYRNRFMLHTMKNSKGMSTGSIYGTLNSIEGYRKRFPDFKMIFLHDTKPMVRKEIYPEYKANRQDKPDWYSDFLHEVDTLKQILKNMDIIQYSANGYEADDLAQYIVEKYKKTYKDGNRCILITGDSDWLQLINDDYNINVIEPINDRLYLNSQVCHKYSIDKPNKVIFIKILKGDSGDNIKGICRIPTKVVQYIVNHYSNVDELIANVSNDNNIPERWRRQLNDNRSILKLNEQLIDLSKIVIKTPIQKIEGSYNEKALLTIYRDLEFKKYIDIIIKNQLIRGSTND